jgi:hypothetical protein
LSPSSSRPARTSLAMWSKAGVRNRGYCVPDSSGHSELQIQQTNIHLTDIKSIKSRQHAELVTRNFGLISCLTTRNRMLVYIPRKILSLRKLHGITDDKSLLVTVIADENMKSDSVEMFRIVCINVIWTGITLMGTTNACFCTNL